MLAAIALSLCTEEGPAEMIGSEKVMLPQNLTEATADLIVEGKMAGANPKYLDLKTIMAFPKKTFSAYDPWDKKEQKYTGVSLSDLLDFLGAEETVKYVEVIAGNNYRIPIRIEDIRRFEYILCYMIDDTLFVERESIKSKGSLIIAINFDKHRDLDIGVYKHQLVWQVVKLKIN